MPDKGAGTANLARKDLERLTAWLRLKSGKSIRRKLERRFNSILGEIARGDPATLVQLPHARWLLDNSHLVRQALQQVETDLPASYYRQLPACTDTQGHRVPSVFVLAESVLDESGQPIDCNSLACFCRDYRSDKNTAIRLTLGELWAVPTALRIALLERLCEAAELAQKNAHDLAKDTDTETARVAGCITSLRTVATFNWPDFVEQTSAVDLALKDDPSGHYLLMDFSSRDRYRGVIEKIARRSQSEQWEVAMSALQLAQLAVHTDAPVHQHHVGYYLVDRGRKQLEEAVDYRPTAFSRVKRRLGRVRVGCYLLAINGLAVLGSYALIAGLLARHTGPAIAALVGLIALIPLLSVSSGAVNFVVSLLVPPRQLPKLDFLEGIPAGHHSMVVVPMLLSSSADIAENLKTLEHNYLGNSDPQLSFALLSDFTDATEAETPQDQSLLEQALGGIDTLNQRYGKNGSGPFLLFHRQRLWNENAQCWMGWERKRGKLEEFNELLRGSTQTSYVVQHGYLPADAHRVQYVITLDADSYMPMGTARRLIGTMAHPLNRPLFDESTGRVVRGYTVIQPRLETNPVTGADTLFARIFAGDVMLDLYSRAVSDVYQDLFGEAVFAGKGIYDLDGFRRSVANQVPENTVLSHDLLEGLLGRAGLVSDIVLLENYPANYLVYLQRLHRWIRGDWQLWRWLFSAEPHGRNTFHPGIIGRWKLVDNLRRSLFAPAILTLLIIGWLWLPGNTMVWTWVFALFPGLPILLRLTLALRTSLWRWGTIESSLRNLTGHAGADVARWFLTLVFLPAESCIATGAAIRTLYRVLISKRNLLEWSTAAQVSRSLGNAGKASRFWFNLWFGPAIAAGSTAAIFLARPSALPAAAIFILSWLFSPLIALYLSRPVDERQPVPLNESEEAFLRGIARDTWRFFERFVSVDTHWLPPDNVQEFPQRIIAERTSPTNIGMMFLATLTAYDLGYLGQRQLLTRLSSHLNSIQAMDKHRGHLFNWYSTRDLQPLEPLYVSTVDSGNLVAALIVTRQALEELSPVAHAIERNVLGLADELAALRRHLFADGVRNGHETSIELIQILDAAKTALRNPGNRWKKVAEFAGDHCDRIDATFLQALQQNPDQWNARSIANFRENSQVLHQRTRIILEDFGLFAPWIELVSSPPPILLEAEFRPSFMRLSAALLELADPGDLNFRFNAVTHGILELTDQLGQKNSTARIEAAKSWLEMSQKVIAKARLELKALDETRRELAEVIERLIEKTDFRFLYDTSRNLFRVGYNASTGEPDPSHYDLLASEARLASFIAIAKGHAHAKHWMHLGRPLTRIRGLRILLSWSATAFEYLMPRLIMSSPPGGLISQSCAGAVKEQIHFGRVNEIPWGVSESGYAQFDAQGHYQYYAFGIPRLGLKWDQGERLVISSYASVLALPFAPGATIRNMHRLISLGASGPYGFYEALDFGEALRPRPESPRIVQSYMSHHQGMILLGIGNALTGDETLHRFHRDPRIASVEHLLFERLPSRIQTRPLERLPSPLKELPDARPIIAVWQASPDEPELSILSNGHLSSRLSDQGGGALHWRGKVVTRWNPFAEGPASGSRIYLKDLDRQTLWRLGGEPLAPAADVFFAPHAAEFRVRGEEMLMRMVVTVAPDKDIEIRNVTIGNDSAKVRNIMLYFYSEPVLGDENADRQHLAFSKLFVESTHRQNGNVLLFHRRCRNPEEQEMFLAQAAVVYPDFEVAREYEVDRGAFLGRGGDPGNPAALSNPAFHFNRPGKINGHSHGQTNLDACAMIAIGLRIPPRTTAHCALLSSIAATRASAVAALESFQSAERLGWVVEAARLQSEHELTQLRMNSEPVREAFKLLAGIHWPPNVQHVGNNAFQDIHGVQDALWRKGISGDRPIVTLRFDGEEDLLAVEKLLQSIAYLDCKDFSLDAIFLDETTGGYTFPLNERLRKLVEKHLSPGRKHGASSAFIIPVRNLLADEKQNLIAASRVFIDMDQHSRNLRLLASSQPRMRMPAFVPQPSAPLTEQSIAPIALPEDLLWKNRLGGMLRNLDGYSMLISDQSKTPAPWCNILANPEFGTLVSESGSMCTWWRNSSENRLTPWNNDPVLDQTGEAIYIRDEETGKSWSLTPQPRPDGAPYRVTHAIGESIFEHNSQGLEQFLQVFVDSAEPAKILRVGLTNVWPRKRRLTVTFAAQWLLGNCFGYNRHLLVCELDAETGALLLRNGFLRNAGNECAFVASNLPAHGMSCDGREFFGSRWSWTTPNGLSRVGLSDYIGPSAEPCAVFQVHIDLREGEKQEFHFALGAGENPQSARELITRISNPGWVEERHRILMHRWDTLLGGWQIKTPEVAMDALINRWLLYQVISSRLWGRIGFYQSSGGFGFRDQLQDVLALLDTQPETVREHIQLAASRQFEQGDVLHWWHEAPLRGVRTRCSDDLLWLPFAVSEYVEATGDAKVIHETAPFLQADVLGAHEQERYAEYQAAAVSDSIYEHCCRAIDARLEFGAHDLPFFGTGDWNDGMNRVGEKGHGESVWMAWFLAIVCRRFVPLCERMDDGQRAEHYKSVADDLIRRTRKTAWADAWYVRGYFDDGTPLGAPGNSESEIDLNAQTWAVLADRDYPTSSLAMQAVKEKLVDTDHRLLKLLTPPFNRSHPDPGYIKAYPPGVRENGGQYTHAAVWAAWAAVELGDRNIAMRWFEWLNPLLRARTDEELEQYRLEPYVVPGDIYGVGALAGRGGWSWYTGSAAWLYRLGVQQLLGLQRRGNCLFIRPCLPAAWPVFEATYRHVNAVHHLRIHEPANIHLDELFILRNGEKVDTTSIVLEPQGRHELEVFASDAARESWLKAPKM